MVTKQPLAMYLTNSRTEMSIHGTSTCLATGGSGLTLQTGMNQLLPIGGAIPAMIIGAKVKEKAKAPLLPGAATRAPETTGEHGQEGESI